MLNQLSLFGDIVAAGKPAPEPYVIPPAAGQSDPAIDDDRKRWLREHAGQHVVIIRREGMRIYLQAPDDTSGVILTTEMVP